MRAALSLLAAVLAAVSLHAQPMPASESSVCTLPDVLQAWSRPAATIPAVTERRADDLAGQVNQPYRVSLSPCAAPWCKPGGYAAMVKISIPTAGRWRVVLDSMLWIDVWTALAKQEGVLCEHHGCRPLRKIVQYDLQAGPHWVVLEGKAPGATGFLMVRVGD